MELEAVVKEPSAMELLRSRLRRFSSVTLESEIFWILDFWAFLSASFSEAFFRSITLTPPPSDRLPEGNDGWKSASADFNLLFWLEVGPLPTSFLSSSLFPVSGLKVSLDAFHPSFFPPSVFWDATATFVCTGTESFPFILPRLINPDLRIFHTSTRLSRIIRGCAFQPGGGAFPLPEKRGILWLFFFFFFFSFRPSVFLVFVWCGRQGGARC